MQNFTEASGNRGAVTWTYASSDRMQSHSSSTSQEHQEHNSCPALTEECPPGGTTRSLPFKSSHENKRPRRTDPNFQSPSTREESVGDRQHGASLEAELKAVPVEMSTSTAAPTESIEREDKTHDGALSDRALSSKAETFVNKLRAISKELEGDIATGPGEASRSVIGEASEKVSSPTAEVANPTTGNTCAAEKNSHISADASTKASSVNSTSEDAHITASSKEPDCTEYIVISSDEDEVEEVFPDDREFSQRSDNHVQSDQSYCAWRSIDEEMKSCGDPAQEQERLLEEAARKMAPKVEAEIRKFNTQKKAQLTQEALHKKTLLRICGTLSFTKKHGLIPNYASANPYEVLGLPKCVSSTDVKRQYMKLALVLHPDKNSHAEAKNIFHKITNAYATLKGPLCS